MIAEELQTLRELSKQRALRKKASDKAYYARNSEAIKKRVRKYNHDNPEKIKAYKMANSEKRALQCKDWRKNNPEMYQASLDKKKETYANSPEKYREAAREYYADNAEDRKEAWRLYREANPEKVAASQRRYRKANPEKLHAKYAKRRALEKGAYVEHVDRKEVFNRDDGICGICFKPIEYDEVTLDHIIPLVRGGEHSMRNIQLAHLKCNSSKGAKILKLA